jgi:Fur family peroxide stress response transcriptional regulator
MDRSPKQLQQRIDHMVARCRQEGMNVTPQRVAIYRALLESEEHPTPEMLFRTVSAEMPSLSLATIYKTLDALTAVGLVRSVPVDSEKRRYDANDAAHHHLVCSACGCIRDYYSDEFDALLPPRRVQGFAPQTISVNITGICGDCRGKKRKEV